MPAPTSVGSDLRLSIVFPAYNEEPNVAAAIAAATRAAERLVADHEIIVVDDGSTDRTAEIVAAIAREDPRVRMLRHGANRGYGDAVRNGLMAARLEYVFFTDADLQFDMEELELLLPYAGRVDVVAGYRRVRRDRPGRRVAAWGWNTLVRVLFYVSVRDIDCAFKLFDRRVLGDLHIESVGAMVNTELMVKLGRSGVSVVEVGVTHRPRRAGKGTGASPRVVRMALSELLKMRRKLIALDAANPVRREPPVDAGSEIAAPR